MIRDIRCATSGDVGWRRSVVMPPGSPHYFVSGAGAKVRVMESPEPSAVFASPGPGFVAVSVGEDTMAVDFIEFAGGWTHRARINK